MWIILVPVLVIALVALGGIALMIALPWPGALIGVAVLLIAGAALTWYRSKTDQGFH